MPLRDIIACSPLLSLAGLSMYLERICRLSKDRTFFAKTSYMKLCGTTKTLHIRRGCVVFAEIIQTVTHSDKHVREGSSGVLRHIDRWDDPISLLSPQPIDRGASLMSPSKLDNSGLGIPHSRQHFFNANLERKSQIYHITPHLMPNSLRVLSFEECNFATTGWKMNL